MKRSFVAIALGSVFLGASFEVHAASSLRIISRAEWGADDTLLTVREEGVLKEETDIQEKTSERDTISKREKDCLADQKLYPEEFAVERTVEKESRGRTYRWPLRYSKKVKMIVVHHTAQAIAGSELSPKEQMRSLYQMHAEGRGWGDIGYHFVIGNDGSIFEGKAGGDYVVGGHVYCHNVGTVGIALMGHFGMEVPSQAQMRSLQWLIAKLQRTYNIAPNRRVTFHGKDYPPVVGHRDLISTDCPGTYVAEVLDQVRSNVAQNNLFAAIRFPTPPKAKSTGLFATLKSKRTAGESLDTPEPHIEALSATSLTARPGGSSLLLVRFIAGEKGARARSRIATVSRSNPRIGLTQEYAGRSIPVRSELLLPADAAPHSTQVIRISVDYPVEPGSSTLTIGDVRFAIDVSGRRVRTPEATIHTGGSALPDLERTPTTPEKDALSLPTIRIRLSSRETGESSCDRYDLQAIGKHYRGTTTCTVVDGEAAIINVVDLEEYMMGLAEEPDTEPFEKQRAFAIAARSYALYYTDTTHRKFPGNPYDGDDSPARFQSYRGLSFEEKNPQWLRAVRVTAGRVLTVDGAVIKPPYFSSDDGRTRSPEEIGWKNFPHAEIFSSKPDPWCKGMLLAGHGVGMSGCGAEGLAREGKTAEQILEYYYPGTSIRW